MCVDQRGGPDNEWSGACGMKKKIRVPPRVLLRGAVPEEACKEHTAQEVVQGVGRGGCGDAGR